MVRLALRSILCLTIPCRKKAATSFFCPIGDYRRLGNCLQLALHPSERSLLQHQPGTHLHHPYCRSGRNHSRNRDSPFLYVVSGNLLQAPFRSESADKEWKTCLLNRTSKAPFARNGRKDNRAWRAQRHGRRLPRPQQPPYPQARLRHQRWHRIAFHRCK